MELFLCKTVSFCLATFIYWSLKMIIKLVAVQFSFLCILKNLILITKLNKKVKFHLFYRIIYIPFIQGVLNSVGLVPPQVSWVSCKRAIVPLWVQNFFSQVLCGSDIFSLGYFVSPNFFLVGISWVYNFFLWVFRGSKISWLSINFSKKTKETYGSEIFTESFK